MMRVLKRVMLIIVLGLAATAVLAQENPMVEVVLSQPTAQQGDIVTADIYVRGGTNVGGIDIGIEVDEQCLRIIDRQPGGYFPTTDSEGAFSAFSELNEHNTRLASALTDRTKYVNGDGVFYSVQLEVTCQQPTIAAVNVSYAQVSSYVDPTAEIIDVISYDLDNDTLTASNTQLEVIPGTADSSVVMTPTDTTIPTPQITVGPTSVVAEATPITSQDVSTSQDSMLWVGAFALMGIASIGLIILFVVARRRRSR